MSRTRNVFLLLSMIALVFGTATYSAAGTIVFSNLVQPGDQYGPDPIGFGHTPAYPPGNTTGYFYAASRFSVTTSSILTEIRAPWIGIGSDEIEVLLLTDAAGVPGSVIESYDVHTSPPPPFTSVVSTTKPLLLAGHKYWVAATTTPQSYGLWVFTLFQGNPNPSTEMAFRTIDVGIDTGWSAGTDPGPTARRPALVIVGDPIPEPSTWLIEASGIALLVAYSWRRRTSVRTRR